MNHYPKLSLILLMPFATIASDAEKKTTRGITFVPGRAPTSAAQSSGAAAAAASSKEDLDDFEKPAIPAAAAVASISATTGVVVTNNDNELATPYRRIPAQEQKNSYVTGKDGIAKITRLETSDTYIQRLLRDGKFADAANHTTDSFLPDHLRRALSNRQEDLSQKAITDKKATLDLFKKQREANNALYGMLFPLLDAITKHTPKGVTPDSIDAFQQKIFEIQKDRKALLAIIAQEISEQTSFLDDISTQLNKLRKAQSAQAAQKSDQ